MHIKYGYLREDDYYVIKIASGFYDNAKLGLPTSNGMMLLFNQKTGEPVAVLLDEGNGPVGRRQLIERESNNLTIRRVAFRQEHHQSAHCQ